MRLKLAPLALTASALALVMTTSSCSDLLESTASADYFASDSTLPFKAPDFTQISESAYLPAFEQGMEAQQAEVQTIIDNEAAPTFENTIVELERSGRMLSRVGRVFFQLTGTNTTETLDEINTEISPKLADHNTSISLNPALFERVKAVYDQRDSLELNVEEAKLLSNTYEGMVHAGALLTEEQRERVKVINSELSSATTEFAQTVRNATNQQPLIVDTREELAGLSDSDIETAAERATELGEEGKFALVLQNTTQQPLIPNLENRETRERFLKLSLSRADGTNPEYDTRMLVAKIAQLRAEKAELLGKPDWASYNMYQNMADTPKKALDFMAQMVPALAATQAREADILNARIAKDGKDFTVQPWDWYRYANMVRQEEFNYSEEEVTQYLQMEKVLEDGVFHMATELYGLTFERRDDIPTYHEDVWVYTIKEENGDELALFYFDPFQRPSKRGGAWMGSFVPQNYLFDEKPVIYNVLNVPKAPEGEVQTMSFDWVNTTFHEFGHALHGMFAEQKFTSLSGTATPRDFVEYPAQVHEMWRDHPEMIQRYTAHVETGEPMPMELFERIKASSQWNQGYDFGEVVEAALLDMKWHSLSAAEAAAIDTPEKVDEFEAKALSELGLDVERVPSRYRSTYFNHIFSSPTGYSSGYYSYLWTQMLDHDSRDYILARGGLTREMGQRLREQVLSRGGTLDYDVVYRNFAERDPDVKYMLSYLGLTDS